ncbi:MAG: YcbK family protein [Desulfosarcina sp.]|nr:YcbK family protein [Desulfobacterales bacterium]
MTGFRTNQWLPAWGLAVLLLLPLAAGVRADARFFYSGDGHIRLVGRKNGAAFEGVYRNASGRYEAGALQAVYRVFDAPYAPERPRLALRLIEFLDYLEDHLGPGARITITSGYRSPAYNRKVRQGGGLAAKASLHQYGMAADFIMEGVPSRQVWAKVKALGFGGTGYYHGATVHVDVGPARYWDEKTSGVGTGLTDDNKLIGMVTDFDIYPPQAVVTMRFIRMTAFPIGVAAAFDLRRRSESGAVVQTITFRPEFAVPVKGACPSLADIDQMAFIRWRLPANLPPGRYDIEARFCASRWDRMPATVTTPTFEIRRP